MKVKENMERKFLISKAGALLLRRRRQSLRRAGGNGDVVTIFGSNRDNSAMDFGMYLGNSFLETGSMLITDVVQKSADNNWGKGKPQNAPKSIEDMMKTSKGLKELNKMTTKELLNKSLDELWKQSLWDFGQNAFSTISKNGFESEYLERKQQNSNPYPSYPYPSPYNQNMNYSPTPGKDMQKSKKAQYEMLIKALSFKK